MQEQVASSALACKDPFEGMDAKGIRSLLRHFKPLRALSKTLSKSRLAGPLGGRIDGQGRGTVRERYARTVREHALVLMTFFEIGEVGNGDGGGASGYWRVSVMDCPKYFSRKHGRYVPFTRELGWKYRKGSVSVFEVERMLEGNARISLGGIRKTPLCTLDFDCKGEPPREWRLSHPVPEDSDHARAKLVNEWRAERLGEMVKAAQAVLPEEDIWIQRTEHGFHASFLLDEAEEVAVVAELAERWRGAVAAMVGGVPAGCGLEAFPVVCPDGTGRSCALPLGAKQRLVGPGLVNLHHTRALDFERLFSAGLSNVASLRVQLAMRPTMSIPSRRRVPECETAPRDSGQLFGSEFVIEVLRIESQGMGRGESGDSVRRMTPTLLYAGMSDEQAMVAFERFVRSVGLHGARHCTSERGIRELLSKARSQIRHFRRGERERRADGSLRCWRNGLRSKELRAALWGLLGAEPKERPMASRGRVLRLVPKVPAQLVGTELGRFLAA